MFRLAENESAVSKRAMYGVAGPGGPLLTVTRRSTAFTVIGIARAANERAAFVNFLARLQRPASPGDLALDVCYQARVE
jgi:hypothetical protein